MRTIINDINVERLMNEDDFEIDTESRDGLQGVKQDPVLNDEEKLAAQERPRTSGGRAGRWTLRPQANR